MAWTSADDVVRAWIDDDAPTDLDKVQLWIDRAERMIRREVPGIQVRLEAAEPDLQDLVSDVVFEMVRRVFQNFRGVRTYQEGTGPFQTSETYGGDQPGALLLTSAELERLSVPAAAGGAGEIDLLGSSYRLPFASGWSDAW
jgi:hypothetical protein